MKIAPKLAPKLARKLALASAAILSLALFASDVTQAQDRSSRDRADRPLPGRQRADPGKVAATDIAFARHARDNGQWTAFREYAASGAQMHGNDGPFDAGAWLAARPDPSEPISWAPNTVWSSCDGSLAVSFGRWLRPDKTVGSYITVWQRQNGRSGDYRWIYDTGTPDNPQPPPPPVEITPDGDTIVVRELLSIRASSADCGAPAGLSMDGLSASPAGVQTGGGEARDGTLRWRWEQHAPGQSRVVVDWIRDGAWAEALAFDIAEG